MKLKKKSGFTLIEMLIVVAIIAVLVAVSIPMVNNALEKSRVATDAANERACKAEALLCFLNGTIDGSELTSTTPAGQKFAVDMIYKYDAALGKLVAQSATVKGYGKCAQKHDGMTTTNVGPHNDMILFVRVDAKATVYMQWAKAGATVTALTNNNTCHGTVANGTVVS